MELAPGNQQGKGRRIRVQASLVYTVKTCQKQSKQKHPREAQDPTVTMPLWKPQRWGAGVGVGGITGPLGLQCLQLEESPATEVELPLPRANRR